MPRRGRLPTAEREARREELLDAAVAELVDHGYDGTTMLGVARRAGASKETLYRWFGDRDGLFAEVVERAASRTAAAVETTLDAGADPADGLVAFASELLRLLTGERSIALNRAAMAAPPLASLLLAGGRHTVGPIVEAHLARLHEAGVIHAPDPAEAFRVLYGLVVGDRQIRVLLGEAPPPASDLDDEAAAAVARFLALHRPRDRRDGGDDRAS